MYIVYARVYGKVYARVYKVYIVYGKVYIVYARVYKVYIVYGESVRSSFMV